MSAALLVSSGAGDDMMNSHKIQSESSRTRPMKISLETTIQALRFANLLMGMVLWVSLFVFWVCDIVLLRSEFSRELLIFIIVLAVMEKKIAPPSASPTHMCIGKLSNMEASNHESAGKTTGKSGA